MTTQRKEYYLYTDLDQIHLKLYLLGKPEGIRVSELDEAGTAIRTEEFDTDTEPVLVKETQYYRISGLYEGDSELQILTCVYDTSLRPLSSH